MRCSRRRVCRLRCVPKGDYQEQSPCLRHSRSDSVLRPWEGPLACSRDPSPRSSPSSASSSDRPAKHNPDTDKDLRSRNSRARNGPGHYSTALRRLPDKYGNGCDLWTTRIAADRARTTFPLRWFGHPASGSSRDISLIEVNLGLRGPSPYPSPGCASLAGRGRIRPTAQGRKHARQNLSQTGGTAHHATCRGPVPQ